MKVLCLGDDGSFGGQSGDGRHPYIRDATGKGIRLAEAPDPGGEVTVLRGDWAAGWVTRHDATNANMMAARWNLRTGRLSTFPQFLQVVALSGSGAAVMTAISFDKQFFVSPDGQITDLPRLSGHVLYPGAVVAMSFDGRTVVGTARTAAGTIAVVWRFG
jgi:hypothetical protein